MLQRTYPYTAWLLTRSFQLQEIELVARGFSSDAFDRTENGRNYPVCELYGSREAALAEGEKKLAELAADIAKRQANLKRRRNELLSQR
ncbi:MAG: hypothetical protein PW845_05675 [Pseudomonas sp.]|uniref:hypothetical protein n=1 Tax=Pseudomonas abieticivorans TaxID=2931382 RepID=UPI0020BFED58|nr:hypothetical protein [Pseudomonas sp. PIA16]MDE1164878.1 hypothetical protein [Pseudomonas sp.]